jgi:hypothetical protein
MYKVRPGLVLGFHGCDQSVRNKVILGNEDLRLSINKYDWLGIPMSENRNVGNNSDLLLRELDCDVIETCHKIRTHIKLPSYDSVRGVFWEGAPLYENAGFREKNHTQLCIRNPNCIKGYFLPRELNKKFRRV